MKILKEIAYHTSTKEFYNEAKEFGERAAVNIEKKAQLQNLQTIADSTLKVTDILNYIKNQASKHSYWNKDKFTSDILDYLYEKENEGLHEYQEKIIESENLKELSLDHYDKQHVYLLICREFIKQVLVHYNFKKATGEEN